MIATMSHQKKVAEVHSVKLAKIPPGFEWLLMEGAQPIALLVVERPANAIFDEGISWEDAAWQ
jgi:hypothetical protein